MNKKLNLKTFAIAVVLSLVASAPAMADTAKAKKSDQKSFSIMKNVEKQEGKSKSLDTKDMKKVKGGSSSMGTAIRFSLGQYRDGERFNSAKEAVFSVLGK